MALSISVVDVDANAANVYIFGTLTPSGNYSTGGDTLDFSTIASQIISSQAPVQVWIGGTTGDAYAWVRGSALNNQKVKVNTASNTELASGAYPARVSGDVGIQFEAVFNKLI